MISINRAKVAEERLEKPKYERREIPQHSNLSKKDAEMESLKEQMSHMAHIEVNQN